MSPHGTTTEKRGCKCDWCRRVRVLRTKKWRVVSSRRPMRIPADEIRPLLADLAAVPDRLLCVYGLGPRTLVRARSGETGWVLPRVAEGIRAAWADYCAPIDVCDRRWPVRPLREAIDRRWPLESRKDGTGAAPPLTDSDRAYLYHNDSLDEARADRLCAALGFNVEEIWATWFQLEETA